MVIPGKRSLPRWVRGAEWPPRRAKRDMSKSNLSTNQSTLAKLVCGGNHLAEITRRNSYLQLPPGNDRHFLLEHVPIKRVSHMNACNSIYIYIYIYIIYKAFHIAVFDCQRVRILRISRNIIHRWALPLPSWKSNDGVKLLKRHGTYYNPRTTKGWVGSSLLCENQCAI